MRRRYLYVLWGVGNVGTPSDSVLCSQFCSCYDAQGREAVKAPLEETSPGGRK